MILLTIPRALPVIRARKLTNMSYRPFCSDDDFKPRSKIKVTSENANKLINKWIEQNDIVLFMKGTPQAPQCGYSNYVVEILNIYGIHNYYSVNVLTDPIIREQIKVYSNWPTIPQLYLKQQFIGGCDIIAEMHQEGSFQKLLEDKQLLNHTPQDK